MKQFAAVFAFAVIIGCAHAQIFGVPVQVTGGVVKSTSFFGVISIDILLDRDASFVLDLYQDLTIGASATVGFSSLSSASMTVGYSSGVNLTVNGGAIVLSCNISVVLLASLSGGAQAGFLQYDASVQWYNTIYASSSTLLAITVPVPSAGLFLFVSWTSTASLPTFFAYARQITGGVSTTVAYAKNITVQVLFASTSALTATYYSVNPVTVKPSGFVPIGTWFDLQSPATSNIAATISYTYSASQLVAAGVSNASALVIGYFDSATAKWVFPTTGASVNTNTQVVSQTSTHFSNWGVYADASSANASEKIIPSVLVFLVMLIALII